MIGAVLESEMLQRQRIESALKSVFSSATALKVSATNNFFGALRQGRGALALAAGIVVPASALITFMLAIAALGMAGPDIQSFTYNHRLLAAALFLGTQLTLVLTVAAYKIRNSELADRLAKIGSQITSTIEAAEVGLWCWNTQTQQLELTDLAKEILALNPAAQYDAAKLMALVNADDLTTMRHAIRAGYKSGRPFDVTFRLIPQEGEPVRSLRCRGRSQIDENGHALCISGTLIDVSEYVAMQSEIEHQWKTIIHLSRVGAVGKLSGALAHELSQPLTAIMNNAHAIERMLNQNPVNIPELRNAISDIIEDDSRVRDVIRHLRSLLRKDSSGFDRVDMTLLIHKVLGLVRKELALHRIKVMVKIAPDVPMVWGDDVQLQQLLLNLITNAIDAMATSQTPGGSLTITAYGAAKTPNVNFHLRIADTGNGLPSAAPESVFDAFYSTKDEGLGLGLSICQAIVTGHQGTIGAQNNGEGGATFHVTLPIAPEKLA